MNISSITETNGRKSNQDSYFISFKKFGRDDKCAAILVADGMGGTEKGDVASKITKEIFDRWFEHAAPSVIKKDGILALKPHIIKCAAEVNEKVLEWSNAHGETTGSTMALLILRGGEYIACNIGDSRIYKFGSKSMQITKDHTLAALEVEKGNLSEEEASTDKRSHKLTQCIGMDDKLEPDFFRGKYRDGDYFLLCSDGMYNRMTLKELEEIVKGDGKTKGKLIRLFETVKEKGETDNVTGVLIECV